MRGSSYGGYAESIILWVAVICQNIDNVPAGVLSDSDIVIMGLGWIIDTGDGDVNGGCISKIIVAYGVGKGVITVIISSRCISNIRIVISSCSMSRLDNTYNS